jgi:hypothetical protein
MTIQRLGMLRHGILKLAGCTGTIHEFSILKVKPYVMPNGFRSSRKGKKKMEFNNAHKAYIDALEELGRIVVANTEAGLEPSYKLETYIQKTIEAREAFFKIADM